MVEYADPQLIERTRSGSAELVQMWDGSYWTDIAQWDDSAIDLARRAHKIDASARVTLALGAAGLPKDLSRLECGDLTIFSMERIDLEPLYTVPSTVRHLDVSDMNFRGRVRLEAGRLPGVERLVCRWAQLDAASGFGAGLRSLLLYGYNGESLAELSLKGCEHVQNLDLVQARKMVSLDGAAAWHQLRWLELTIVPQLASLDGLHEARSLRIFRAQSCKRLVDVDALAQCTGLESLLLEDCPQVGSIAAIRGLPNLLQVGLNGSTVVRDLDLSPLRDLPKLRAIILARYSRYNETEESITRDLSLGEWVGTGRI